MDEKELSKKGFVPGKPGFNISTQLLINAVFAPVSVLNDEELAEFLHNRIPVNVSLGDYSDVLNRLKEYRPDAHSAFFKKRNMQGR